MKIGKIPEATLKKVILEQLGAKRDEVLIGPGIGEVDPKVDKMEE